tara:strand:+ start:658 stop:960 length:303 start_codon:yes stop_codon:yes gene_type:complete
MIQTINFWNFQDAFYKADRQDQFTNKGKKALFNFLEEYEDSTDEQVELDVIALCCDYVEYENIEEFWLDYDKEDFPHKEAIEWHTLFIPIDDNAFIIQSF